MLVTFHVKQDLPRLYRSLERKREANLYKAPPISFNYLTQSRQRIYPPCQFEPCLEVPKRRFLLHSVDALFFNATIILYIFNHSTKISLIVIKRNTLFRIHLNPLLLHALLLYIYNLLMYILSNQFHS